MLLVLLAGIAVNVDGESTCPTPARVAEQLSTLVVESTDRSQPDHARLREHDAVVEVELESGSGRLLGRREFPIQPSCDELASAIAVAIATWEAEFSSASPEVAITAPTIDLPTSQHAITFEIGGGPLTTYDRAGWAIGGTAELFVASTATRWSASIAAFTTTRARDNLEPGDVSWVRNAVSADARYRVGAAAGLTFGVMAGGMLARLTASGDGFSVDRMSSSVEPGLGAGASVTLPRGWWSAYLEASETVWLRADQLQVTGVSTLVDLPQNEFHLNLGIALRFAKI